MLVGVAHMFFTALDIVLASFDSIRGRAALPLSLGETDVREVLFRITLIPVARMNLLLCPNGAEGASYASLAALQSSAYSIGDTISAALAAPVWARWGLWDVSSAAIAGEHFGGVRTLCAVACGVAVAVMVAAARIVPTGPQELEEVRFYMSYCMRLHGHGLVDFLPSPITYFVI
jgi:hypothetical protein